METNEANQQSAGVQEIRFRGKKLPFFEFSNYWPSLFKDEAGLEYPTSEHYFQAMKFPDNPEYQEKIRANPDPKSAKLAGRGSKLRSDWGEVKLDVMF